jgi:hypothetical protein
VWTHSFVAGPFFAKTRNSNRRLTIGVLILVRSFDRFVRIAYFTRNPPKLILAIIEAALPFPTRSAPLAQLDRASGYEPEGREFESLRAHHF